MKKTFTVIASLALCICVLLTGCGKKKTTSEGIKIVSGTPAIDKCVTIPKWKGIKLNSIYSEPTEKEISIYALSMKESTVLEDPAATAQEGDTVNINYVGTLGGKEFEGGTAENVDLVLGSDSYIEGFEDGIVGMKTGDVKTITVTFPDNYAENVAGKDASFEITLNAIKRAETANEEELKKAKTALVNSRKSDAQFRLRDEAWNYISENAKWKKIPKAYIDKYAQRYDDNILDANDSIKSYLSDNNIEEKDYKKDKKTYAEQQSKAYMLAEALREDMGLTIDGKIYKETAADLAESYGVTLEELEASFGEDEFEEYIVNQMVMNKVVAEANVVEKSK